MNRVGALVARSQRMAELLMDSVCFVDRPGPTITDTNGKVSAVMERIYPSSSELGDGNPGRCKIQQTIAQASTPAAGGHTYTVQDSRVDFPAAAGPFRVGDVVTMTGSVNNPHLIGNVYRISEEFEKEHGSSQRVKVKQVTA